MDTAPHRLLGLDLIVVVGKGGVGRTTVSAALALAAARQGKRVLIAMPNVKERLSKLLEVDPIGPHNQRILPSVEAVNMTPTAALEEYGMMVLKVRALYRAIFENRFVAAFLRGTPGLDSWSMLGKVYYHALETDRDGRRRYDLVIFDAPATGHALDMFRVPRVLMDVAPPGPLRREAQQAWQLFTDPTRCGFVLTTIPEDMPTNETLELSDALSGELRVPVKALVVNRMLATLFPANAVEVMRALPERLAVTSEAQPLAKAARTRVIREDRQRLCLERLASAIPTRRIELPNLVTSEFHRQAIESLSLRFAE